MTENQSRDNRQHVRHDGRQRSYGKKLRRLVSAAGSMKHAHCTAAGLEFTVRSFGTGHPIVFLCGGAFRTATLGELPRQLGDIGRVHVVELGEITAEADTAVALADYRTPSLASAFDDALRIIGARQGLILIGQGTNGLVAAEWARRHPDRVLALGFIDGLTAPLALDELTPQWADWATQLDETGLSTHFGSTTFANDVAAVLAGSKSSDVCRKLSYELQASPSALPLIASIANLPIEEVSARAGANAVAINEWLQSSSVSKLFVDSQPFLFGTKTAPRTYPNQTVVRVSGPGHSTVAAPGLTQQFMRIWLHQLLD